MTGILKFFVNALKAIFFSPFYLLYFVIYLVFTILNHFVSEIIVLCTGFRYGNLNYCKYERELRKKKKEKSE